MAALWLRQILKLVEMSERTGFGLVEAEKAKDAKETLTTSGSACTPRVAADSESAGLAPWVWGVGCARMSGGTSVGPAQV